MKNHPLALTHQHNLHTLINQHFDFQIPVHESTHTRVCELLYASRIRPATYSGDRNILDTTEYTLTQL